MLSKRIFACVAVLLAVMYLAEAREEGPRDIADTLRMLQELDRFYSQAARPRIDRRADISDADSIDAGSLDRAVRLLQLHKLDKIYSFHTRPRPARDLRVTREIDENYLRSLVMKEQILKMDVKYKKDTLPRFGKRSLANNWSGPTSDVEKPDIPAWLAYARRR